MAGIAGRAAGIPVAAAPAAPMPKIQNLGLRAVTEPGSSFSYRITSNGADTPLSVRGNVSGDEAYIQWMGDWNNKSGNTNSLGVGGLRALREQIRKDYPNVTRFRGDRISGANPDRMQSVAMHANPDTASLPALFDYAMPPGGLLAPPEEPPLPGLLAYFTKDRPGEPPVNTIPRGREDPFDRYNDPWGEVPMIINNPFADPPPPELPRMPRPLPFLLGPVGQR